MTSAWRASLRERLQAGDLLRGVTWRTWKDLDAQTQSVSLEEAPGISVFQSSPGDSNKQPELRTSDSSGFLPWHVQATGTEDNFCPFPAWRWHATLSLLLLLTLVSASANTTDCSSANSSRKKREREREREWSPTLPNFLERPASKPLLIPTGAGKKKKRESNRNLCPSGLKSH